MADVRGGVLVVGTRASCGGTLWMPVGIGARIGVFPGVAPSHGARSRRHRHTPAIGSLQRTRLRRRLRRRSGRGLSGDAFVVTRRAVFQSLHDRVRQGTAVHQASGFTGRGHSCFEQLMKIFRLRCKVYSFQVQNFTQSVISVHVRKSFSYMYMYQNSRNCFSQQWAVLCMYVCLSACICCSYSSPRQLQVYVTK